MDHIGNCRGNRARLGFVKNSLFMGPGPSHGPGFRYHADDLHGGKRVPRNAGTIHRRHLDGFPHLLCPEVQIITLIPFGMRNAGVTPEYMLGLYKQ